MVISTKQGGCAHPDDKFLDVEEPLSTPIRHKFRFNRGEGSTSRQIERNRSAVVSELSPGSSCTNWVLFLVFG